MLILAFDTSTNKGGVALQENGKTLSSIDWEREGSHGELLTPALEKCLADAKRSAKDLDALAIGHGPGSFTGVRIAVNAARTFAYALDKPVFVFDTSEILAAAVTSHDLPVAVLINAHKNLIFASTFEWDGSAWKRVLMLDAFSLDDLKGKISKDHLCIGDGFDEFSSVMDANLLAHLKRNPAFGDEPSAEVLGRLAFNQQKTRKPLVWKDVQALYIRASGAEEKLREDLGKKA